MVEGAGRPGDHEASGRLRPPAGDPLQGQDSEEARGPRQGEKFTAGPDSNGRHRPSGLLIQPRSPGGTDAQLRVWGRTRDCRTPDDVVFGPTVASKMGESGTPNTAGLLFCFTGYQSPSCTANEEDTGLTDGLGKTADVQLGQKARDGIGGLMSPPSKARRPSLICIRRLSH